MSGNRNTRFEGLDILRGLAAMAVVLTHYTSYCLMEFGEVPFHLPRETGYYAVLLFFMISGFVIYFSVERSETWRDFAISRLTRLYPAYWTTLTIVVVAEVLVFGNPHMWWGGYLSNMTMLQEFLGYENYDVVYWSLTVELAFYLIIGILFKAGLLQRIGTVALIWLALSWIGILLEKYIDQPMPTVLTRYLIVKYVPFFLLGIMLYLIRKRGVSGQRTMIIVAAFATIWMMHSLVEFTVSLALYASAAFAVSGSRQYLVSPILRWLGAISYSLYLVHRNLGYLALTEMHKHGLQAWMALLLVIFAALALASFVTYFVERPVCSYLRTVYRQVKGNSPIVAT